MNVLRQSAAALRALLVLTVILGVAFPLSMVGVSLAVPHQATGSLIRVEGRVVGSALLGQKAEGSEWFQARPSTVDWTGDASGGSNLSPTSADLAKTMREREAALRAANPDAPGAVPQDALTASASGLDPQISPAYAAWQAPRVAKARGLSAADVQSLIDQHTDRVWLGFFGTDTVNVTELNVALATRGR